MKNFTNYILTGFISLLICFFMFFAVMSYLFIPKGNKSEMVAKTNSSVPYSPTIEMPKVSLFIKIENCPVAFNLKISETNQKLLVTHNENLSANEKNTRQITFDITGFENTINYLGGVEIDTPYGLPSPAKNKKIIAENEKLLVYGASLGEILTSELNPSDERKSYYCYVIKELCVKFLKECTPESYKFLKRNCETDISYTEFYDNYKSLKNIKR